MQRPSIADLLKNCPISFGEKQIKSKKQQTSFISLQSERFAMNRRDNRAWEKDAKMNFKTEKNRREQTVLHIII